ncbi:hypothetical protein PanWU01x14_268390 [Parasponia andersonii]|uniref:Uncharacterized protein n=1 Tax=Parasponia andersonii TaxID=3476 RepID=A0A2P5B621_PARAD|nr:hypothetical protein PanWU01x14_268390 [Parasponia andersonii]
MVVRASFDDFLLVSHQGCYYICNPFTRQYWLALPENMNQMASPFEPGDYGFVCDPNEQRLGGGSTAIIDNIMTLLITGSC